MANLLHWESLNEIESLTKAERSTALFLERHPDYPSYFLVNSFDPLSPKKLYDVVGNYSSVHMLKLNKLYKLADAEGYGPIVFLDYKDFSWLESLDEDFSEDLNVELKKFQLQGFNLTKDLPAAIINWSTGTGKSVYSVARAKYLLNAGLIDKVVVCAKNHNRVNWVRTFNEIGGLTAYVAEAPGANADIKRERRGVIYETSQIVVINYEKLRFRSSGALGDGQEMMDALKGKRVFWIWDEMPTKMKNSQTAHFKGAAKLLKSTSRNYQVMLSATPIEVSPEDLYICMKLLDPSVWPNLAGFRQRYAKSFSTFSPWQVASWDIDKLQEMSMRISHITHQANKYRDPEIRSEFPQEHWEDIIIEMSEHDRKLYDKARKYVAQEADDDYAGILAKMAVLQMICNNPESVSKSDGLLAQKLAATMPFTDRFANKLDTLKEMLTQIEGKIVLFSMFADYGSKMLAPYLAKWGHTFVLYDGKQLTQDTFKNDPTIKIFLSSDKGSDSINLQEASTVINYDLPWNYSTLEQRVNRINRITSEADHVFYYNLIMENTLEERKIKLLQRKKQYQQAVFDGDIGDQAVIMAGNSLEDLKWLLG